MAQEIFEPDDLAGNASWDGITPQQLWAGEYQKHTTDGIATAAMAKYTVVMADPATPGNYVAFDGAEGSVALGFTCQPSTAGGVVSIFDSGAPNHEALVWPSSLTTFAQRKAAFAYAGSNIFVGRLLG